MVHPVRVLCALSLAGALLLASHPALACSCVVPELAAAREGSAAVFEGRVLSVSAPKHSDAGAERAVREVTLAVVRSWKGLDKNEQVVVRTAAESSLCGFVFSKGKSYLVFADDEKSGLSVSSCSRTRAIADARDDLTALGAGATPVSIVAKAASAATSGDAGTLASSADAGQAGTATTTTTASATAAGPGMGADGGVIADAGVVADAGAPAQPPVPKQKSGGCASTRGQASLAPYFIGVPALMGWRRRRERKLKRS